MSTEILRKYADILEGKLKDGPSTDEMKAKRKEKKDSEDKVEKAEVKESTYANVKPTAADHYRKFADICNESWGDDDEEDPDVAKADSVKGKDGSTQSDSEKKLPPWLKGKLDKADKKDEEKGVKAVKKMKKDEL